MSGFLLSANFSFRLQVAFVANINCQQMIVSLRKKKHFMSATNMISSDERGATA